MNETAHIPVLLQRSLDLLLPTASTGIVIDGTLGLGGHSEALLAADPAVHVVGIDRDENAITRASARLAPFGDRFTAVHTTYDRIADVADQARDQSGRPVLGVLLDLGVSSMQLDQAERGFSYARSAPLDMRMDPAAPVTAADLLATATVGELTRILRTYGEEKYASRIASRLVDAREVEPLRTTDQVVQIVRDALPQAAMRTGGHPAKRTFQALRIAVNDELRILEETLPAAIDALAVGGRIVSMSYQSLEDRPVKAAFAAGASSTAPPDLPVVPDADQPYLRLLTRGAERAGEPELAANPRSAPVRLRAAEKLRPVPPHRRSNRTSR